MNEKKDNLEEFFEKRLQGQSFEFDEAQWQRLSQRLDEEEDEGGFLPWLFGSKLKLLIGLVLVGIIAFWLGWYFRDYQLMPRVNSSSEIPLGQLDTMFLKQLNKETAFSTDNTSYFTEEDIKPQADKNLGSATNSTRQGLSGEQWQGGGRGKDRYSQGSEGAGSQKQMGKVFLDSADRKDTTAMRLRKDKSHKYVKSKPVPLLADAQSTFQPIDSIPKLSVKDSVEYMNQAPWQKVAIGVFIAPDFNRADASGMFSQLSGALGLEVHYRPFRRIRLGTGFSLNTKNYGATAEAYKPKAGFWTNGIKPESIDAECLVLNVPIEMGFKLNKDSKNAWWVNMGLSNYWMLSELYNYQYTSSDPSLKQSWEGKTKQSHPLSSLDISISYSRNINRKLAFTIRPYFKYHLKGIGHGAVDLLSSGINLGICY